MSVFSTTSGVYFRYMPTHLIGQMHVPADLVFKANVFGILAFVLGMPVWGVLRDRFGWAAMLAGAGLTDAGTGLWFFSALPGIVLAGDGLAYAFVAVGALGGIVHALLPALICSLFPTPIRQSGFALPYSIGTVVISGLPPSHSPGWCGTTGWSRP